VAWNTGELVAENTGELVVGNTGERNNLTGLWMQVRNSLAEEPLAENSGERNNLSGVRVRNSPAEVLVVENIGEPVVGNTAERNNLTGVRVRVRNSLAEELLAENIGERNGPIEEPLAENTGERNNPTGVRVRNSPAEVLVVENTGEPVAGNTGELEVGSTAERNNLHGVRVRVRNSLAEELLAENNGERNSRIEVLEVGNTAEPAGPSNRTEEERNEEIGFERNRMIGNWKVVSIVIGWNWWGEVQHSCPVGYFAAAAGTVQPLCPTLEKAVVQQRSGADLNS